MGIPESPSARGACPTDEELAAFLDRMLPAEERARITAHLADCEDCYEIFAGAVHFQQDESALERDEELVEELVGAKEGRVVPFPVKKERDAPSRKLWWVAAAALFAVGFGLADYKLFFSADLSTADLKAKVNPAQDFYRYAQYRGGDDHQNPFVDDAPRFMIGVLLTDLRLGREQGNIDADRLEEVGRKLKKVGFAETEAQAAQASAEKLKSGSPTAKEEVAKSLPAQEAAIEEILDAPSYRLGKWSEAGRLAAVTRTPDFFSRWGNKRFFAALLKTPLPQDDGVAEPLAAIKTITDRGNFQTQDYKALSDRFTEIIRHYDI